MYSYRKAFTMIELILVIVILGIVASIGSEVIANVYEQYIVQRAQHRASLKTELATLQIANRLTGVIPGTLYRIKNDGSYESVETNLTTTSKNYIGLKWVGADVDSFNSSSTPGWSGFCDVNASSKNSIVTRGSNLSSANTIESNLGKASASKFAIFFPYDINAYFGSGTSDTITLDNNASTIYEHYKLAWTSYALVVENNDLYLYYNFTPTVNADYSNQSKSLLMKNISTFKFRVAGRTIRFKICKQENIGEDFNITSCKEKAVF